MDNIKFTRVFDHATKRWIEVPEDVEDQEEYVIDVKKELARRHYKVKNKASFKLDRRRKMVVWRLILK